MIFLIQFRIDGVFSISLMVFLASDMQIIPIELNLHTKKWLLLPVYRPPNQNPAYFRENLQQATDFFSSTYDNILMLGDFNMDENEAGIRSIMEDN